MTITKAAPSTKLIQFLNGAYDVPAPVIMSLLERFDDVESRNQANLKLLIAYHRFATSTYEAALTDTASVGELYQAGFKMMEDLNNLSAEETQKAIREMLADAVIKVYQ